MQIWSIQGLQENNICLAKWGIVGRKIFKGNVLVYMYKPLKATTLYKDAIFRGFCTIKFYWAIGKIKWPPHSLHYIVYILT